MRVGHCFPQTVAVLAVFNVARSFGMLGPPLVSAAILCLAVLLVAWRAGLTRIDLGLGRDHVGAGLRWGVGALLIVSLTLLAASVLPTTNAFLHDSRANISGARMVYELFVTIFLGTVIPEELAFRGVLLASGMRLFPTRRAVPLTSALFGLWHIAPTLHTMAGNETVRRIPAVFVVSGAVAVTFVAGLIFCWLRLRSNSLVAPVIAHLATNGVALAAAWFALH